MARQRTAGYEEARSLGLLTDTADYRVALCMSGFTHTKDSVHLDDGVLDEYDGTGYSEYLPTGVAVAYDSTSDEWRITCDNAAGNEFGTTVGGATEAPSILALILEIDGTDANDYLIGYSSNGTFANGNGGAYGLTLPNDVLFFSDNAP